MRAARRVAAVLTATALMIGAFATQAAAIGIDVAGLVIETPQI
ncbi:hypothetical protein OG252_28185 [Streptomyces sp. NBC_01352]|uniref:Uncharacterized protein n=1 Tax=Streptomyces plumbiresistens TaxID=511811 RepID=A0ABP7QE85_9ACTN|nr:MULTISPECIES: hypothetical protein [unclassified Streptomyces]MCX4699870.1 hypothetical protein [Streptomyces sp. NBC_01373]MDQ1046558.1 hypothetical protein [Streptomyces sp. V4I2]